MSAMEIEEDDYNRSQTQTQMYGDKEAQKQETLNTQMVLEMTQEIVSNIKELIKVYAKEYEKENGNKNQNNNYSNKNKNNEISLDSELGFQKMKTGQFLTCLRLMVSDNNIKNNPNTKDVSLIEINTFKQEILNNKNMPHDIKLKVLPFIDHTIQTLNDYTKTQSMPAPKLDKKTFNQEAVSQGMGKFLGAQHKAQEQENEIRNNSDQYYSQHQEALKNKDNKKLINDAKYNNQINPNSFTANALVADMNRDEIDMGDNDGTDASLDNMLNGGPSDAELKRKADQDCDKKRNNYYKNNNGKGINNQYNNHNCNHNCNHNKPDNKYNNNNNNNNKYNGNNNSNNGWWN